LSQDGACGVYAICSDDFNPEPSYEMPEVAQLLVDLDRRTFEIRPSDAWLQARVLPPHIFYFVEAGSLPSALNGYTCFALSRNIYRFASECITRCQLPVDGHRAV
jgi:hypothetical protein